MFWFFIGLFLGVIIGIGIMCLMVIGKCTPDERV